MAGPTRTVDLEALHDIVRRIVEVAEPEQIVMFGSAARGRMGRNSDVDLLVIKQGANRLALAQRIYAGLHGAGEAVDVIVVTPEDVERYRDNPALIIASALQEGEVIYDARQTPPG
jgi:predicted nucleotidyltransferase